VFSFEDIPLVVVIPYRSELFRNAHHKGYKPRAKKAFSPFLDDFYEVLSESTLTVIVLTASAKEYERGGQGHTFASLLHQSAT
jgi:hypothetical protein